MKRCKSADILYISKLYLTCCNMSISFQKSACIQARTSSPKFLRRPCTFQLHLFNSKALAGSRGRSDLWWRLPIVDQSRGSSIQSSTIRTEAQSMDQWLHNRGCLPVERFMRAIQNLERKRKAMLRDTWWYLGTSITCGWGYFSFQGNRAKRPEIISNELRERNGNPDEKL